MKDHLRRFRFWLRTYPHTLISFAAGLLCGVIVMIPLGIELPGTAAALVGTVVGVAGTVGGALWAANAKQDRENLRDATQRVGLASLIASILAEELGSGRTSVKALMDHLDEGISDADKTGKTSRVYAAFLAAVPMRSAMCDRFLDRLDVFGDHFPHVMGAVEALLSAKQQSANFAYLTKDASWSTVSEMVRTRRNVLQYQLDAMALGINALRSYHPSGDNDALWTLWTQ